MAIKKKTRKNKNGTTTTYFEASTRIGGKERTAQRATKREARDWLKEISAQDVRGEYVEREAGDVLTGIYVERYVRGLTHITPNTRASYESLLRSCILPTWADVRLRDVTNEAVADWLAGLAQRLSASRARQAFHILKPALDIAVRNHRIRYNPATGIELPKLVAVHDRRYLDHVQLDALASACVPYRTFVLLLGYSGLRWGEAVALRARDVNFLRRELDVVRSIAEVGGELIVGDTKGHERRTVPYLEDLHDALAEEVDGRRRDDLVFTSLRGYILRNSNFRRIFNPAAVEVGLDGLVPQELRHTAASLAISAGANVKVVQRMLGHKSATLTWDRYGHLFPSDLGDVMERVSAARAQALAAHWPSAPRTIRGPWDNERAAAAAEDAV